MSGSPGFLDRDLESYSRLAWAARVAVRNLQWSRTQGVRRLVEEHELHPVRNAVTAARRQRWRLVHGVRPGDAIPVFLVGVPRSGTNMMVRALAGSPEFEVHNEGDRAAFYRYRLRPESVARDLVLRSRHRFVLFKPLLDTHRIGTLLDQLGTRKASRALWAYRDVDGRARSALTKFGSSTLTVLREIAAGPGLRRWQAQGLSDDGLDLIRSLDWETATPADAEALFWYVRNRLFFEFGLDRRPDVLPVSYNSYVAAPAAALQTVCQFLGASWDPTMAADTDNRSAARREPLWLDPRIRSRCDILAAELDAAAVAAESRLVATSPASR